MQEDLRGHSALLTFFVAVEAKPRADFRFESPEPVEGYYQTFGVTARNERELHGLIQDYLAADIGSMLVGISERWIPDFDGVDRDIEDEVGDLTEVGIW